MQAYGTVEKCGAGELEIKRSRFLARACPVRSEEEARAIVQEEKKKYCDARHTCWACVLDPRQSFRRYADDGEPQGTAGLPILDTIVRQGLTDVVVTVTRYFGGILLGTGGLTHAYSSAAALALEDAGKCLMLPSVLLTLETDYPLWATLGKWLEKEPKVKLEDVAYGANVTARLCLRAEEEERVCRSLLEMSAGRALPGHRQELHRPWPDTQK